MFIVCLPHWNVNFIRAWILPTFLFCFIHYLEPEDCFIRIGSLINIFLMNHDMKKISCFLQAEYKGNMIARQLKK